LKLLILLIKWGFPILLISDLSSELLESEFILNISRVLRTLILILLIKENIANYRIIKKFIFFKFLSFFLIVLFLYLFTDQDFAEGFWVYSKILYWVLGVNILFAYGYRGVFKEEDFLIVLKRVILIAFIFTVLFFLTGYIKEDYNIAAYLVLFMYPLLLYNSDAFKFNKFFIILSAFSIFITLKRGAILAFTVSSLVYYFGYLKSNFSIKKLVSGFIIITSISLIGLTSLEFEDSNVEERFNENQFDPNNEKAGSGRVGLYMDLYDGWYYSDNLIFGFGNQEDSRRIVGRRTHAHSDIFGFLYNYGLVGITLILLLYIKIIKFYFYYRKYDKENSAIIISLFFILVLVNFYSGLFRTTNVVYFFSILPYLQLKVLYKQKQQQVMAWQKK